jgi:hypothetical protein
MLRANDGSSHDLHPGGGGTLRMKCHCCLFGAVRPLLGRKRNGTFDPKRVSNVLSSNSTNSTWAAGELAGGLMNPQHLKLLSDWSDLYRHLITLAFTQHGPAQRGFAADDLNELSAADQLHAASIRA